MPDPSYIDEPLWHGISVFLTHLIYVVFMIIGFSGNFLLAHAFIPSLVSSKHLPLIANKLRIVFYLGALVFFIAAIFFIIQTLNNLDVIPKIYDRWWI